FMEMNTRLQVEHPVTEMITGQDLVAWQLRVAAGEPLPLAQEALRVDGHAFEARIYAEDPSRDFLPATGTIRHLRTPAENRHLRIDSGVREGDEISVHYDPLIAKLIVWDRNRDDALRRLRLALDAFTVVGTTTNTRFLARVAGHPAFAAGRIDTGFIEDHAEELFPAPQPVPDQVLAVACLFELLSVNQAAAHRAQASADPWSPWHGTSGWQPNSDNFHTLHLLDGTRDLEVIAHYRRDGFLLELPDGEIRIDGQLHADGTLRAVLDGVRMTARVLRHGDRLTVVLGADSRELVVHDPLTAGMEDELREGSLTAPMPGNVLAVLVEPGDVVEEGTALMVLEAMKMEHTIRAFTAGVVDHVNYGVGDQVAEGAELLAISPEAE
ncbi:MAG: biotin/lipoyl-containing protein, partial [Aquisalimonadaceae bacterium]